MAYVTLADWSTHIQEDYAPEILDKVVENSIFWTCWSETEITASGDHINVPMITGDGTGNPVTFNKNGVLPTAQAHNQLMVRFSKIGRLYGRIGIDGLLLAIGELSDNNLAGTADALATQMKILERRITNTADVVSLYGGQVRGLVNQHQALTTATGVQTVAAPNGGDTVFQYSGDWSFIDGTNPYGFGAVVTATNSTWVRIRLCRTDDAGWGNDLTITGGANNNLFITAYDKAAGTITVTHCEDGGPGATANTNESDDGHPWAVLVHTTQAVDSAAANLGRIYDVTHEPNGFLDHMFNPVLGESSNRSVSAGPATNSVIRGQAFNQATSGSNARAAMTYTRYQEVKDIFEEKGAEMWDVIACHPRFRSVYLANATASLSVNVGVNTKNERPDMAYGISTLDGLEFRVSRTMFRGGFIGLKKSTWEKRTIAPGKFEDRTGSVLQQIADTDAFSAYWRHYYMTLCTDPRSNVAFVGVTY